VDSKYQRRGGFIHKQSAATKSINKNPPTPPVNHRTLILMSKAIDEYPDRSKSINKNPPTLPVNHRTLILMSKAIDEYPDRSKSLIRSMICNSWGLLLGDDVGDYLLVGWVGFYLEILLLCIIFG
jgi:hypothetical protein